MAVREKNNKKNKNNNYNNLHKICFSQVLLKNNQNLIKKEFFWNKVIMINLINERAIYFQYFKLFVFMFNSINKIFLTKIEI